MGMGESGGDHVTNEDRGGAEGEESPEDERVRGGKQRAAGRASKSVIHRFTQITRRANTHTHTHSVNERG